MKNVLVPLMEGFEEIEFISIVDILRRAGVNAIIAGNGNVRGSHNIVIQADCALEKVDIQNLDGIALAGGYNGMLNLCNSKLVIEIIQELSRANKLVAAICASPIVLDKAKALKNKYSCYPSCKASITSNATCTTDVVCVDGNVITSIGPASAGLFALELVKYLCGKEIHDKLYAEILQNRI